MRLTPSPRHPVTFAMMSEQLFKLKPGQSLEGIPHKAWNAFVDAARYAKAKQAGLFRDETRDVPQTGIVRLKNASGYERNRFDVLGISDVFPRPTANPAGFRAGPVLHGVTPSISSHEGKFAILLEPAADGSIVSACVAGVCVAKVDVVAEWHEYAEVKQGDAGSLTSCQRGSAIILWKEPGLGPRWAVVKIGLPCRQAFWARLGDATEVGPNRWKYSFVEVVHTGDGYGAWVPKPYGRIGYCYNSVEDPNDGAGLEGNGVDIDALDECCEQWATDCCDGDSSSGNRSGACDCRLLPAGPGAIVRMHGIKQGTGTQPQIEYWFQFENQVDCCPPPSSSYSSSSSGTPPSSSSSGLPSSSGGPSSSGPSSSLGEGPTIDVLVCEPYNQCGHFFVFPQKRIHLPPGSWIEDIEASVIPIFECQSSSGSSSSSSGPPSSSDGSSSSSGGSSSGPSSSGSSSGPPTSSGSSSGPSSSSGVSSSSSGPSSSLPSSSGTNPSSSSGPSSSQP